MKTVGFESLSLIVIVATEGELKMAPPVGLLMVRLKVSAVPSYKLSSMIGIEIVLLNSPAAKVSVPLVAV